MINKDERTQENERKLATSHLIGREEKKWRSCEMRNRLLSFTISTDGENIIGRQRALSAVEKIDWKQFNDEISSETSRKKSNIFHRKRRTRENHWRSKKFARHIENGKSSVFVERQRSVGRKSNDRRIWTRQWRHHLSFNRKQTEKYRSAASTRRSSRQSSFSTVDRTNFRRIQAENWFRFDSRRSSHFHVGNWIPDG